MALTGKNIRNIGIYAAPKAVSYSLNLLTLPILTRLLSPADFGVVAMAMLVPTIVVAVATVGMSMATQRYYFEYRTDKAKLDALLFSAQVFMVVMLGVSVALVVPFRGSLALISMGDAAYGDALAVTFVAVYLGEFINFYQALYQNMERAGTHSVFTVVRSATQTLSSLLFVWGLGLSYMGVVYGSLVGASVVAVAAAVHFNLDQRIATRFDARTLRDAAAYGLQLMPKSFSGFVSRFFDKYMLNSLLSLGVVGIYSIGQQVAGAVFFLMNTVWSSLQPVTYREAFDKGALASQPVGRLFTVFAYLALAPVLLVVLFAPELVVLLAPPSYRDAIDVIILLAAGTGLQVFGIYAGVQYAYSKKAYWIPPISFAGTAINVLANVALIPLLGVNGAALSFVASAAAINAMLVGVGQRMYRIDFEWRYLAAMLGLTTLSAATLVWLRTASAPVPLTYALKLLALAVYASVGRWAGFRIGGAVGLLRQALAIRGAEVPIYAGAHPEEVDGTEAARGPRGIVIGEEELGV